MANGVTVVYNENVIHQMSGNGAFTMNTEGVYMEGDVEVVVDVDGGGSTLVSKTITQNGTYDPSDDNADGYNEVVVNVPSGGGGGDSSAVPKFLNNSDINDILINLYYDLFDDTNDEWGDLVVTGNPQISYDGVSTASGIGFSHDLEETNHSVTVYAIVKHGSGGSDPMPISVAYAGNSGNCPAFFVRSGAWWTTVYANDTNIGIPSNQFTVLTLAIDGVNKTCSYYVNGVSYGTKSFSNSGQYVRFNGSISHSYNVAQFKYLYAGIVDGCESAQTIIANHQEMLDFLEEALVLKLVQGGGGIPLFSQADWEALTTAQKQAYGLVAIQEKSTGYECGILVSGANYVEPLSLYDNGTQNVPFTASGGGTLPTFETDRIDMKPQSGTVTKTVATTNEVDVSNYSYIEVKCSQNNEQHTIQYDISEITGNKYIGVRYLSDNSHNEGGITLDGVQVSQLYTTRSATSSFYIYEISLKV